MATRRRGACAKGAAGTVVIVPARLVQRKVRVTAGMDAEVLAYGQAEGKADLAEAYRSIIGRGLRQWRLEAKPVSAGQAETDNTVRAGSTSVGSKLWTTGRS